MKKANPDKRAYRSERRANAALRTRARILQAGRQLFASRGIDATTIAQIAAHAGVSEASVYATVKSKSGLLDGLMRDALFGPRFQRAQKTLADVQDPVRRIALTARVARAIYDAERTELGLLTKSSAFSPELRKAQQAFEAMRLQMQRERIDALYEAGRARAGLRKETARTLLWMYTSREIYHKLVNEAAWTADDYEAWLGRTLLESLTDSGDKPSR
jgi:AcrR family transcriptional regulator